MNELSIKGFKDAIRQTHGAEAVLVEHVHVNERFEAEPVWEGEVLVFDLLDHPTAYVCYAWEVDGQVTAVLHLPPVNSPQKAVRAAILSEESDG